MASRLIAAALLTAALSGAGEARGRGASADWRAIATDADRTRLRTWRQSFTIALAMARRAGNADPIDAEGPLLRPDAALADAAPPPGDYRCRTVKLGAAGPGARDFVATAPSPCRIDADAGLLRLVQRDGPQRPAGRLYPDAPTRLIFLGTLRMADESGALEYGRDPERNMAGIVERIGSRRWRLVLPWPRWEATLEVTELRPVR